MRSLTVSMLSLAMWDVPMMLRFLYLMLSGITKNFKYLIIYITVYTYLSRGGISMLKMKRISETYDMRVFTDTGEYFGDVEESIVTTNKVFGWRVKATKGSFLNKVLGSAKGVIVPHQLVKSIADIMIISKAAVPSYSPEDDEEAAAAEA
ncbi:hypothetical protein GF351_05400 [Candidatus Woesearchaeota archaeon]|nr:hypothetical protein [Candidatus Woesearchaeota archaeon]